ncbi:c-type cytochrome [uncultured Roseobacter sp.]|uniref:c-type cytochrome n=1 Tax=uncultured Roseobacter sp. TaxID=114847 RepID=UPI002636CA38|nr:c-type cytochrome [uncultured Roseobacter sp.]
MRKWIMLSGAVVLVAALAGVFLNGGSRPLLVSYQPNLARGEKIYAEACAACHGANLQGEPNWRSPGADGRLPAPPHDASGHTWHHPDRVLLDITMRGTAAVVGRGYESNMPGFGDTYSEDELRDVLEWIKTQWPERERAHQAQVTAQDQAQH